MKESLASGVRRWESELCDIWLIEVEENCPVRNPTPDA